MAQEEYEYVKGGSPGYGAPPLRKKRITMRQTSIDWLIEALIKKERVHNPIGISTQNYFETNKSLVDQANEMEYTNSGLFLNWLLENYSTATKGNGRFCWINNTGEEVTITEILKHYYGK